MRQHEPQLKRDSSSAQLTLPNDGLEPSGRVRESSQKVAPSLSEKWTFFSGGASAMLCAIRAKSVAIPPISQQSLLEPESDGGRSTLGRVE
jgi:hypothetical protein